MLRIYHIHTRSQIQVLPQDPDVLCERWVPMSAQPTGHIEKLQSMSTIQIQYMKVTTMSATKSP